MKGYASSKASSVRNAFAQATGDAAILERSIQLENLSVLAYETVIAGDLLSPALALEQQAQTREDIQRAGIAL